MHPNHIFARMTSTDDPEQQDHQSNDGDNAKRHDIAKEVLIGEHGILLGMFVVDELSVSSQQNPRTSRTLWKAEITALGFVSMLICESLRI
jgi:hypothetical protein